MMRMRGINLCRLPLYVAPGPKPRVAQQSLRSRWPRTSVNYSPLRPDSTALIIVHGELKINSLQNHNLFDDFDCLSESENDFGRVLVEGRYHSTLELY